METEEQATDQDETGEPPAGDLSQQLGGLGDLAGLGNLQLPRHVMEKLLAMPISEWIFLCFTVIGAQASRHLGIIPKARPDTLDLDGVHLAIESLTGLTEATEPYLPYDDVKVMRQVTNQLRALLDKAQQEVPES